MGVTATDIYIDGGDAYSNGYILTGQCSLSGLNITVLNLLSYATYGSSVNGGGILFTSSGFLNIVGSSFESLKSVLGGAIYASESGEIYVGYSSFTKNEASSSGGAIYIKNANFTLTDNLFLSNAANS